MFSLTCFALTNLPILYGLYWLASKSASKDLHAALWGIVTFLLALLFLWPDVKEAGQLNIVPDSLEFALSAIRYVDTGKYELCFHDVCLPPRYAPTFSILFLSPVYSLFGTESPGIGIFSDYLSGCASVLLIFILVSQLSNYRSGAIAALMLGGIPGFTLYKSQILADVPAIAQWLLMLVICLQHKHRSVYSLGAAGICGALSFGIRFNNLILLFPLYLYLSVSKDVRILTKILLFLPISCVIYWLARYQLTTFGSVFRTGYNAWSAVPYDYLSLTFAPGYVIENVAAWFNGTYIFELLTACTILLLLQRGTSSEDSDVFRHLVLLVLLPACALGTFFSFYFFKDNRFLMPVFIGVIIILTVCADRMSRVQFKYQVRIGLLLLAIFLVARFNSYQPNEERAIDRISWLKNLQTIVPADAILISDLPQPLVEYAAHLAMISYSRNKDYASKFFALKKTELYVAQPVSVVDDRAPGLRENALDPFPCTASEDPAVLKGLIGQKQRIFLETKFTQASEPVIAKIGRLQKLAESLYEIKAD